MSLLFSSERKSSHMRSFRVKTVAKDEVAINRITKQEQSQPHVNYPSSYAKISSSFQSRESRSYLLRYTHPRLFIYKSCSADSSTLLVISDAWPHLSCPNKNITKQYISVLNPGNISLVLKRIGTQKLSSSPDRLHSDHDNWKLHIQTQ